LRIS
jgi:hypothetical protein